MVSVWWVHIDTHAHTHIRAPTPTPSRPSISAVPVCVLALCRPSPPASHPQAPSSRGKATVEDAGANASAQQLTTHNQRRTILYYSSRLGHLFRTGSPHKSVYNPYRAQCERTACRTLDKKRHTQSINKTCIPRFQVSSVNHNSSATRKRRQCVCDRVRPNTCDRLVAAIVDNIGRTRAHAIWTLTPTPGIRSIRFTTASLSKHTIWLLGSRQLYIRDDRQLNVVRDSVANTCYVLDEGPRKTTHETHAHAFECRVSHTHIHTP